MLITMRTILGPHNTLPLLVLLLLLLLLLMTTIQITRPYNSLIISSSKCY